MNQQTKIHIDANSFDTPVKPELCSSFSNPDANIQFNTYLNATGLEFSIYKRVDGFFFLLDTFKSYDEACLEAKDIINSRTELKNIFITEVAGVPNE